MNINYNNVNCFKKDFTFFTRNKSLVFLDSAASAQKPKVMVEALSNAYQFEYANIHRGIYKLSSLATEKFEETRTKIAMFINARSEGEIIFTKGATEAINLIAYSYGQTFLSRECEIIISEMEHHSNIVPWQILCNKIGAKLKIIPIDENGNLSLDRYRSLLSEKTCLVAITHASSVLGTINPIKTMIQMAHQVGAKVLIDACQSIVHIEVDVQELDCDFLVFSAHKLYGPNGVGVLYGKAKLLDSMEPYQVGGGMVSNVSFEDTTFRPAPAKFEAGTQCIAEVIAFGASIDYLTKIKRTEILLYENSLLLYMIEEMQKLQNFQILSKAEKKIGIISFVHNSAHAADIAYILDQQNIAIRSGHHCAQLLMKRYGMNAVARASIGLYNDYQDIEKFINALNKVDKLFR